VLLSGLWYPLRRQSVRTVCPTAFVSFLLKQILVCLRRCLTCSSALGLRNRNGVSNRQQDEGHLIFEPMGKSNDKINQLRPIPTNPNFHRSNYRLIQQVLPFLCICCAIIPTSAAIHRGSCPGRFFHSSQIATELAGKSGVGSLRSTHAVLGKGDMFGYKVSFMPLIYCPQGIHYPANASAKSALEFSISPSLSQRRRQ
jgi:hypothetical protein